MYFNNFSDLFYQFDVNGVPTLKVVKDITHNVRFRKAILDEITLFDEYDIRDGETPEIIAAKYYGNPEYHWIVMLCNQRYDYINDFPKRTHTLEEYIAATYEDPYATHHYEKDGYIVSETTPGAYPVSNYEYEDRLNESKRRIKLISPTMLNQIIANFKLII